MYNKLKDRIAELLSRPRPIKPQTERQLARHLTESSTDTATFLLEARKLALGLRFDRPRAAQHLGEPGVPSRVMSERRKLNAEQRIDPLWDRNHCLNHMPTFNVCGLP